MGTSILDWCDQGDILQSLTNALLPATFSSFPPRPNDIQNILQHVIVRGIERRAIFADEDDRRHFVKRFSDLLIATDTDCHTWSLLDNHFHLLLRPRQLTLGKGPFLLH
jgi:hypothetical protein